jgi:hypothetical protein
MAENRHRQTEENRIVDNSGNEPGMGDLDWKVWIGNSDSLTPSDRKSGGSAIGFLSILARKANTGTTGGGNSADRQP